MKIQNNDKGLYSFQSVKLHFSNISRRVTLWIKISNTDCLIGLQHVFVVWKIHRPLERLRVPQKLQQPYEGLLSVGTFQGLLWISEGLSWKWCSSKFMQSQDLCQTFLCLLRQKGFVNTITDYSNQFCFNHKVNITSMHKCRDIGSNFFLFWKLCHPVLKINDGPPITYIWFLDQNHVNFDLVDLLLVHRLFCSPIMVAAVFDFMDRALWSAKHTSNLSRVPRVYPCKFFLAGVNFYRFKKNGIFDWFYAKKWRFL